MSEMDAPTTENIARRLECIRAVVNAMRYERSPTITHAKFSAMAQGFTEEECDAAIQRIAESHR